MLFSSSVFLFFFLPLVILGYYLLKKHWQIYFLLLASLFFYSWEEPKYIFIILLSITINYVFGILIHISIERKDYIRRTILFFAITCNLAPLFYYKYLNFMLSNLNRFHVVNFTLRDIILPLGILFYTFKGISYVVDLHKKRTSVQKNPAFLGFYISFFPQLLAGPIVRYRDVKEQIKNNRFVNINLVFEGIQRFVAGFSKKILLANSMAMIADKAFALPASERSVLFAWLGAVAYAFQIFFDFAGYSDMAIGLGKMLGFQCLENFNYPYISRSVSEFWRRWHISLSTWFRDYLFSPLSSNLVKRKWKMNSIYVLSSLVVWFLTGLWHGASWNFVIWGLFNFILLSFEMIASIPKRLRKEPLKALYQVLTMLFVLFGWVLFRAGGMTTAIEYLQSMFGLSNNRVIDGNFVFESRENIVLLVFGVLLSTPIFKRLKEKVWASGKHFILIYQAGNAAAQIVLFVVSISQLVISTHNPFIYFNF